ncbi:MAG: type IV pilus twitching motility protein PilT [Planctomycetota bacterium]
MAEPSKEELLIGRIAQHNKLINEAQLNEALAIRNKRKDETQDLGRILRAKGYLDEKQYRSCRKAQEKHLMSKGMSENEAKAAARGLKAGAAVTEEDEPAGGEEPSASLSAPATAKLGKASAVSRAVAPKEEEPEEIEPEEVIEETAPAEAAAPEPEFKTEDANAFDAEADEAKEKAERLAKLAKRPIDDNAKRGMIALLKKAREAGASDLHMSCGSKPFLRINGSINFLNMPVLTDEQNKLYFAQIMNDKQWAAFMEKNDWDGSIDLGKEHGRFRTNVCKQRRGASGVFRVIKQKVPRFQELGLPESLEKFTTYHQGLVLVTGSTGSGKSSTPAALIELINESRQDHVITLEDPIEYIFHGKKCNVTQRQIEIHTQPWANALRTSLRDDPEVIMIGEMRDLETVELAITAAETGHLMFGTLHTTSATRTIDRLLDVFPPKEQAQIRAMVSESLKGVISQQLVPKADGKGRVAALEILFWTPAVGNLIREKRTFQLFSVMQTGRKLGMQLMDDALADLLKQGIITKEEARRRATNPKLFGG